MAERGKLTAQQREILPAAEVDALAARASTADPNLNVIVLECTEFPLSTRLQRELDFPKR